MQQRQLVVMYLLLSIVYTEKYEPCKRTFRKKINTCRLTRQIHCFVGYAMYNST